MKLLNLIALKITTCLIGFHKWEYRIYSRQCKKCGKKQWMTLDFGTGMTGDAIIWQPTEPNEEEKAILLDYINSK